MFKKRNKHKSLDTSLNIKTHKNFSSRYQELRRVGQGGMGTVVVAKDLATNEPVAIKRMYFDSLNDVSLIERDLTRLATANPISTNYIIDFKEALLVELRQEKEQHSALAHLKRLTSANTSLPCELWLVQEYCEMGDLRHIMKDLTRPFSITEISHIVPSIVLALRHVHNAGIVHRDVKCLNVLLTRAGKVKLCDFGRAEVSDRVHGHDLLDSRVTDLWMAPEMFHESACYGTEVDIWALGITMIEMVNREPPFHQEAGICASFIPNLRDETIKSQRELLGIPPPPKYLVENSKGENNNFKDFYQDYCEFLEAKQVRDQQNENFREERQRNMLKHFSLKSGYADSSQELNQFQALDLQLRDVDDEASEEENRNSEIEFSPALRELKKFSVMRSSFDTIDIDVHEQQNHAANHNLIERKKTNGLFSEADSGFDSDDTVLDLTQQTTTGAKAAFIRKMRKTIRGSRASGSSHTTKTTKTSGSKYANKAQNRMNSRNPKTKGILSTVSRYARRMSVKSAGEAHFDFDHQETDEEHANELLLSVRKSPSNVPSANRGDNLISRVHKNRKPKRNAKTLRKIRKNKQKSYKNKGRAKQNSSLAENETLFPRQFKTHNNESESHMKQKKKFQQRVKKQRAEWRRRHSYTTLKTFNQETQFYEMVAWCLNTDQRKRPTAFELMEHPFIKNSIKGLLKSQNSDCPISEHSDFLMRSEDFSIDHHNEKDGKPEATGDREVALESDDDENWGEPVLSREKKQLENLGLVELTEEGLCSCCESQRILREKICGEVAKVRTIDKLKPSVFFH